MSAVAFARQALRGGYGVVRTSAFQATRSTSIRTFSAVPRSQEKKYAKSHEWLEYSADKKTATVGVSEYAAKQLGDVVYVELPEADTEVAAGDAFGAVESVKSASDFYAPVTGKVIESNAALEEKPSLINQDAEGEAWIAKIEVTGEEAEELMAAAEYKEFTDSEKA